MENCLKPVIVKPFTETVLADLRQHVREVRRAFDAPGAKYHDHEHPENDRFNRWYWPNLPVLVALHHSPRLIQLACEVFDREVKPSYAFLSMYGPDGVCPQHQDRPPCKFTLDLQLESDGTWPIYVDEAPYELKDGEALAYSGTDQPHYRKSMRGTACTYMNLLFFHWVPVEWMGSLV